MWWEGHKPQMSPLVFHCEKKTDGQIPQPTGNKDSDFFFQTEGKIRHCMYTYVEKLSTARDCHSEIMLLVCRKPAHVQQHVAETAAHGFELSTHYSQLQAGIKCLLTTS